jgi:hypothetical protein
LGELLESKLKVGVLKKQKKGGRGIEGDFIS